MTLDVQVKKLLEFTPVAGEVKRRTLIWDVFSNGHKLGRVSWFAHWRRYTYFPAHEVVLDAECMTELATFCADQTVIHNATPKEHG